MISKFKTIGHIDQLVSIGLHLEYEHDLLYYRHCFDFLGDDDLETIHNEIHKAYFMGFNTGIQSLSIKSWLKTRALLEQCYPYSDLDADLDKFFDFTNEA